MSTNCDEYRPNIKHNMYVVFVNTRLKYYSTMVINAVCITSKYNTLYYI